MPLTGTNVDATWSAALTFTKNGNKVHGEEMHQSGRGKQWYFGMDADPGLEHTAVARPPISASLSRPAACYRARKSMSMAMQAAKLQISEQILAHRHGAP
ncbi:hypothetical protein P608_22460 [Comamonas thiooxydans]|uniref:Uncharacterized protein n=1 Tax=Comamonas thiooxydans TaxID=363952 RepID=A0A0E3BP16_9BURK|nr:hypothetical protein P609_03975 [Comamonas thiooxydans]KGG95551.1 hypothetical protein P245_06125 [Comamonas thiooxydans]KGH06535.1 hypothetical protein P608_22460 [Comamonas thiooxydans]KGH12434.1 hypothetical protein P607_24650 [Comamonas thiooxydans]KGH21797.1 hypothetical protein P606_17485 [Comamonas thiooxydans]